MYMTKQAVTGCICLNNRCIDVIVQHRSIRKYKREKIKEEDLKIILEAIRRAPSGWGLGWVNVIVVQDEVLKSRIADLVGGQKHVEEAPLLLVFIVDYARLEKVLEKTGTVSAKPNLGFLLAGLVDVGIASAFATIAAESLGYGVCYIAIYSAMCEIAKLLNLPKGSIPIVGLTVGIPSEEPGLRPRPSLDVIADIDKYGVLEEKVNKTIEQLRNYMAKTWKLVLSKDGIYENVGVQILECLRNQGFNI